MPIFKHEYDDNGRHRLRYFLSEKPFASSEDGEWVGYRDIAYLTLDGLTHIKYLVTTDYMAGEFEPDTVYAITMVGQVYRDDSLGDNLPPAPQWRTGPQVLRAYPDGRKIMREGCIITYEGSWTAAQYEAEGLEALMHQAYLDKDPDINA